MYCMYLNHNFSRFSKIITINKFEDSNIFHSKRLALIGRNFTKKPFLYPEWILKLFQLDKMKDILNLTKFLKIIFFRCLRRTGSKLKNSFDIYTFASIT